MRVLNNGFGPLLSAVCRVRDTWGMYVSASNPTAVSENMDEAIKAAPWLTDTDAWVQMAVEGYVILFFDTEAEMVATYNQTIGDDGPTEANPYNGPMRFYALTCGPKGDLRNENT